MKKWVWSLSVAILMWIIGLKFSPEGTISGSYRQLRYESFSLLFGAIVGLMFGLITTKSNSPGDQGRKALYFVIACSLVGFVLSAGDKLLTTAEGILVGAAIGAALGFTNYLFSARRSQGKSL